MKKKKVDTDILIVEDDDGMRFVLEEFLGHFFNVTSLPNGKEALIWLIHNKTRVVVTDLTMPHIDGIQFLKNIRSSLRYNTIKLFVVSGHNDPEFKKLCVGYGVIEYFVKPFNPVELVVEIYNAMGIPINSNRKLMGLLNYKKFG